jgi:ribosomal protein S18 acetylase RimI-like enzyme
MSAVLTLAAVEHFDKLDALVAAFHREMGLTVSQDDRHAALAPLLGGVPHGAIYLIGPPRAPIGYIIVTFGWSVEFGGLDGFVDELYVRPAVRNRGIATETLQVLPVALADAGLRALHLEVARDAAKVQDLYRKCGFADRDDMLTMTRRFP